jgi:hypothetical protein
VVAFDAFLLLLLQLAVGLAAQLGLRLKARLPVADLLQVVEQFLRLFAAPGQRLAAVVLEDDLQQRLEVLAQLLVVADDGAQGVEVPVGVLLRQTADQGVELDLDTAGAGLVEDLAEHAGAVAVPDFTAQLEPAGQDGQFLAKCLEGAAELGLVGRRVLDEDLGVAARRRVGAGGRAGHSQGGTQRHERETDHEHRLSPCMGTDAERARAGNGAHRARRESFIRGGCSGPHPGNHLRGSGCDNPWKQALGVSVQVSVQTLHTPPGVRTMAMNGRPGVP